MIIAENGIECATGCENSIETAWNEKATEDGTLRTVVSCGDSHTEYYNVAGGGYAGHCVSVTG